MYAYIKHKFIENMLGCMFYTLIKNMFRITEEKTHAYEYKCLYSAMK